MQQHSMGAPVSGPLLQEKALQLLPTLYSDIHQKVLIKNLWCRVKFGCFQTYRQFQSYGHPLVPLCPDKSDSAVPVEGCKIVENLGIQGTLFLSLPLSLSLFPPPLFFLPPSFCIIMHTHRWVTYITMRSGSSPMWSCQDAGTPTMWSCQDAGTPT